MACTKQIGKNVIRNFVLLFASITISLLVSELLVRFFYGKRICMFPRYVSDVKLGDFRIRGNIPNSHYWHKSYDGKWEFRINANGFRAQENFEYAKKREICRILLLGDSYTMGYEVDLNKTYGFVLQSFLAENGLDVEVINAAVSGYGTAEELIFFENEGVKYSPDVVILGYYCNDCRNNILAELYGLEGGKLVTRNKEYVPAINCRNFLNSYWLYRWLSENSSLHNWIRAYLSGAIQTRIQKINIARIRSTEVENRSDHDVIIENAY